MPTRTAADPHRRSEATRARRPGSTRYGRQSRPRRPRGGVQAARAARAQRADDRPPEPDLYRTTAPRVTLVRVVPRVFSPDSDSRRDRVTATYRIDERARAVMLVDGRQRVQSKFRRVEGKLVWFGRINGRVVGPGTYEIRLRAVDRAGNRSLRTRAVPVRARFVELSRERIEVVAGKRFSVRVRTDADSYRWLFAGRRGVRTTSGARPPRARLAGLVRALRHRRRSCGTHSRRGRHASGIGSNPAARFALARPRVAAAESRQTAVEREVVRLLRRDHRRVLPEPQPPNDPPVLDG